MAVEILIFVFEVKCLRQHLIHLVPDYLQIFSQATTIPAESLVPLFIIAFYHNICIESINDFSFEKNTIIVHDNILKQTT